MKYTVVLSQPVPNEMRPELSERLSTRFGLSEDQAIKLASRKPGRLLKPTSKSRADTLLSLYETMGLKVTLEEVVEDDITTTIKVVPIGEASDVSPVARGAVTATPAASGPAATEPVVEPVHAVSPAQPAISPAQPAAPVVPPVVPAPAPALMAAAANTAPAPTMSLPTTPTLEQTFADVAEVESKPERRFSLRQRVLVTTLLPVVLAGLASVLGTLLSVPQAQKQVIREGARALAASVGTSVNINDVNALDTQLSTLVQQPTVGFVALNTPDGLQFFRSKNEEADFVLGEQVNQWMTTHQGASSFVGRDKPADRYALQLQHLKESGVDVGNAQAALEEKMRAPDSQKAVVTNYELQQVAVYRVKDAQGSPRKVAAELSDKNFKPEEALYTIAVGVIADQSLRVTRQSVLIQIILILLATGVAAFFAVRTGRRIVQPIEALVEAADKISLGQLDTPVTAERNDEIGDLARALERMRLSLEAAMERLRRRRNR